MTLLSSVSKTEGPLHWLFIFPPPPCIPFCIPCILTLYTFSSTCAGLGKDTHHPHNPCTVSQADHQHQHLDLHLHTIIVDLLSYFEKDHTIRLIILSDHTLSLTINFDTFIFTILSTRHPESGSLYMILGLAFYSFGQPRNTLITMSNVKHAYIGHPESKPQLGGRGRVYNIESKSPNTCF